MNEQLAISADYPIKARYYDYPRFSYPWHFHPEYEINYVKESSGTRFIGNNISRFEPGDIFLLGSNLPHYLSSDEIHLMDDGRRVQGTIVQFEQDFMYHPIKHYPHLSKIKKLPEGSTHGLYFPSRCSAKLTGLLEELPTRSGFEQLLMLLQVLQEMSELTEISKLISNSEIDHHVFTDTSRTDKILSYLNQHYTRLITLEEISHFSAMNPSAFCRFFKSKTGRTFKEYILDMRIAYACKLLIREDLSIAKISSESGFDTLSHFNKCFKRITGQSPKDYKYLMTKK